MKLSLRNKFLLPTLILIFVFMGTMSTVSYLKSKDFLQNSIEESICYKSNSVSRQIGSWVRDRKLDIKNHSNQMVYRKIAETSYSDKELQRQANEQLSKLSRNCGYYDVIIVANANGETVACSNASDVGKMNIASRQYFKESMAGSQSVSEVLMSRSTGNPIFVISSPIYGENNDIVGVFSGAIDLSYMNETFVSPVKTGNTGYAYVMDAKGLTIAHPDKQKILKLDLSQYDFGRKILQSKTGLIRYTFDGVDKIVAFSLDTCTGWRVATTANIAELFAPVKAIGYLNLSLALGALILGGIIIFFIAQSVANPINRIIGVLNDSSEQIAAASAQVTSASQQLAEGSSEQASSLEETSSSLEEMASMTKQNSLNANEANTLMKETNQTVSKANESMSLLTRSMEEISNASGETSKIIKTIDEIAFQTNLLALNAAVEAARAGEAGAGFAVVAEEVRNLAMRSAEAAKNTADLIETTIKKIHEGSEVVENTNEAFTDVADSSIKISDFIGEIAAASQEQAQGIEQINRAIADMDKVTQQAASNSEETAAASEEMDAQAGQMKEVIRELVNIVGGGKEKGLMRQDKGNHNKQYSGILRKAIHAPVKKQGGNGLLIDEGPAVPPNRIIPLEQRDFSDF